MILQMFPLKCKLKKKTQGVLVKKTQNSSQIQKKLKPKSKKTQKAPTPVEMSCQKNVQKKALNYWFINHRFVSEHTRANESFGFRFRFRLRFCLGR